jgi:hypothetical protein
MRGGKVHTSLHIRHCVTELLSGCRGVAAAHNSSERLRVYGWLSSLDPFTLAWDRLASGEPEACADMAVDVEARGFEGGEEATGCGGGAMVPRRNDSACEVRGDKQEDVVG